MNDAINAILSRRSNRGFTEKALSEEQMMTLKACALASPTAMNMQSWHFSFITKSELLHEVEAETCRVIESGENEELKERMKTRRYTVFYGAPLVVFISASPKARWGEIEAGIASENLALAAQGLGLGSVIIGLCENAFLGENRKTLENACGFPEEHEFKVAIAIGYPNVSKEAHPVGENKISIIE